MIVNVQIKYICNLYLDYNYGKFLNQCLEIMIHQTIKFIEIIIVDDGSTDNSKQIIQEY